MFFLPFYMSHDEMQIAYHTFYGIQKTDLHISYLHVFVDKTESYYATVFSFEIHTNGDRKIKTKNFSENELDLFLDGISEESINNQRDRNSCDCECDCSCEEEEEELPKVNVKRITEKEFKKSVQEKILDAYSIGLSFKEEK